MSVHSSVVYGQKKDNTILHLCFLNFVTFPVVCLQLDEESSFISHCSNLSFHFCLFFHLFYIIGFHVSYCL
jgi:hypothetical protein